MSELSLTIDGVECAFKEGDTILKAALDSGLYVPNLCYHPDLRSPVATEFVSSVFRGDERFDADTTASPGNESGGGEGWSGCGLCVVEVTGSDEPIRACATWARDGMEVFAHSERVVELRRRNLAAVLQNHPHACLTCAEREGCSRITCSLNVPVEERCCPLLGRCELQKVAEYVGIPEYAPKYRHNALATLTDEPLYSVDYNLCIACGRCVRACNDLRQVKALGAVRIAGKTVVGHRAAGGLAQSECRFCGACVEVCPTGALTDKAQGSGPRENRLVPCRATCPAGVDVPQYIRLIAQGRYDDATHLVRERAPLPLTLGSACFHPCETTCRRSELDEAVAICALKRFAAERESSPREIPVPTPTGKKVAIIGSGPAGLTCAWFLSRKGHSVDILEAGEEPGGMMTQAIPEFRLPKSAVLKEIERLKGQKVRIMTSTPLKEGLEPDYLLKGGYDAVFVAVGNTAAKRIAVPGADGPGVYWGLELLREVKSGAVPSVGERVIVIGGGNVAVDAALTALRLGATEVHMVCLEKSDEMPAHPPELRQAISEGVVVHNSWGPSKVLRDNGDVLGVEFVRCTSAFDGQGRFSPTFDESKTYAIEGDGVILAIGQALAPQFHGSSLVGGAKLMTSDPSTCATRMDGVYAGGEASRGPLSIIGAVQEGRVAASAMDKFLGGDGVLEGEVERAASPAIGRDEGFSRRRRVRPESAGREAAATFSQLEAAYTEEQARAEASRCLQCDLRLQISPVVLPPETTLAMPLDGEHVEAVPQTAGVYRLLDASGNVTQIKGAADLKDALRAELERGVDSVRFEFEEDPMYTQRESELIQQYLQRHGKMPGGGGDDLDDLF
jgi:formate dehydrogenase beta subunit